MRARPSEMGDLSRNTDQTAASDPDGERPRHLGTLPAFLIALTSVLFVFIGLPYAFLVSVFWAADGSWNFEGRGVRYWLFVSGTRTERLGLVAPAGGAPKYSVGLQEGTFPGWAIVSYRQRCIAGRDHRQVCAALRKRERESHRAAGTRAKGRYGLGQSRCCEFERYINAEFFAERTSPSAKSQVSMKVWGRE